MPHFNPLRSCLPLSAMILLGGCIGTAEINDYPTGDEWHNSAAMGEQDTDMSDVPLGETTLSATRSEDPLEREAEGVIIAPEVVNCYVGETLVFDLELSNPELGELRPSTLPEEASFEAWDGGASVQWVPKPRDVGQHDFVFLVVDVDEPDLVLAHKTILVSVLARFSLVEYGF